MEKKNLNRRLFIRLGCFSVAALPLLKLKDVFADDHKKTEGGICPAEKPLKEVKPKKFELNEKKVKKLKYIENAVLSDHKKYKKGQACGNCTFYKYKKEVGGYAPCSQLQNKYVNKCGWCKQYAKKSKLWKKWKYFGEANEKKG